MTLETKIIAAIVLSVLLALVATFGMQHYMTLQNKAAVGEQRGQVLTAASGIIGAADQSDTDRAARDTTINTARNDYQQAKRNEPTLADREYRAVPDSLRALARQRRIARERSGRPVVGSQAQPASADAAER